MTKTKLLTKALLAITCCLGIVLFINTSDTFAITKTWTGLGGDDNFSTAANWSDGIVPQNGDDLLFPDPSSETSFANANIPGLQVNSIEIFCGSVWYIHTKIDGDIIVTNSIKSQDCHGSTYISVNLTLVGNLEVTNISLTDTVNAGPYTLDLNIVGGQTQSLSGKIIGSGVINFNNDAPTPENAVDIFVSFSWWSIAGNTDFTDFSGMFNINSPLGLTLDDGLYISGFAQITMNVNPGGVLSPGAAVALMDFPISININRPGLSLIVGCYESGASCLANLPNITLYSDATFLAFNGNMGPDSLLVLVDITGIETNGYCLTYQGIKSAEYELEVVDGSHLFIGGPDETCKEGPGPTDPENPDITDPDAPNTGKLILNNISLLTIISVISVLAVGLTFKLRLARK